MEDLVNTIITNIANYLVINNKKQSDLAKFLNLPKQTINKMLNGSRMISAPELIQIAKFFDTSIEALTVNNGVSGSYRKFMGEVHTEGGRKGIEIAEKLIEIHSFHKKFQTEEFVSNSNKKWVL